MNNRTILYAYCWRSGLIQFDRRVPEGALMIASGTARKVQEKIKEIAYCNKNDQLVIPGIACATDDTEAFIALCCFIERAAESNGYGFRAYN